MGVQNVISAAFQRRLDADDVFDALLRMEQRWRTLSRVKVTYAYRAEFLGSWCVRQSTAVESRDQ
jgi:hypothetical protein